MSQPVTQADVGKRVESHDGTQLGVAASIDDETVYVEPNPGTTDSIKAALGWETGADDVVPVQQAVIGEVSEDAIRLDSELAVQGGTVGTGSGRPPDTTSGSSDEGDRPAGDPDLEVDPSELIDQDSNVEIRPDEDLGSRTDAAAGRDTEAKRTDADVEPSTEPRRSDARTGRTSSDSTGGPTTEDSGLETGDVDPLSDAQRRPTELDEPRDAVGERDDIGELDEPGGPDDRTDIDEFGAGVDRSDVEDRTDVEDRSGVGDQTSTADRSDIVDPAASPRESERTESSATSDRMAADIADDRDVAEDIPEDRTDESTDRSTESADTSDDTVSE